MLEDSPEARPCRDSHAANEAQLGQSRLHPGFIDGNLSAAIEQSLFSKKEYEQRRGSIEASENAKVSTPSDLKRAEQGDERSEEGSEKQQERPDIDHTSTF